MHRGGVLLNSNSALFLFPGNTTQYDGGIYSKGTAIRIAVLSLDGARSGVHNRNLYRLTLPRSHRRLVTRATAKSKRKVLPRACFIELVIPVRIQHPEKARPEYTRFRTSVAVPISYHRHIASLVAGQRRFLNSLRNASRV